MKQSPITKKIDSEHSEKSGSVADERESNITEARYRFANQRGFFLTGEDVLKSLELEIPFEQIFGHSAHRIDHH